MQWSFGGFFIVSYIFGLGVWMYGFLVTYQFWGGTGTFIGLLLGVVGVVPLGIIAAALHGTWYYVGELIIGIAITYQARVFALFLMKPLEPRADGGADSDDNIRWFGTILR